MAGDGAPESFPVVRADLGDDSGSDDSEREGGLAIPQALYDVDLDGRGLRTIDEVTLVDGDRTSRWSQLLVTADEVTQTAQLTDTPQEQVSDEHYWEYEQWSERTLGGEWVHHDEANGYEPPYRFADSMTMVMPSSLAIEFADEFTYVGTEEVDAVSFLHYCVDSPYVGYGAVSSAVDDIDRAPRAGLADVWVYPDGYVTEMTARSEWSDGRTACWATSLRIDDQIALPGLDAPAPVGPLFEPRFGSNACDSEG